MPKAYGEHLIQTTTASINHFLIEGAVSSYSFRFFTKLLFHNIIVNNNQLFLMSCFKIKFYKACSQIYYKVNILYDAAPRLVNK